VVDLGARLTARSARTGSALVVAAKRAPADLLNKMVERGTDLEVTDAHGWTPLFHAVAHGNEEGIAALLELGADTLVTDRRGLTALDVAIRTKRRPVIEKLLRCEGLDCSQTSLDTALGRAAKRGWWSLVDALALRGADVASKIQGEAGMTPLMYAARRGELQTAAKLLEYGADVLAKDRRGHRARGVALQGGHTEVAHILMRAEQQAFAERRRRRQEREAQKQRNAMRRVEQYG
jgi:ankyrin